jgi:hypothetical protein
MCVHASMHKDALGTLNMEIPTEPSKYGLVHTLMKLKDT